MTELIIYTHFTEESFYRLVCFLVEKTDTTKDGREGKKLVAGVGFCELIYG